MNRHHHRTSALLAALLAAVTLAYLNALGTAFQFDDYNVIVNNPAVHSWEAWLRSMPGIRPLLKFSYFLNWRLSADPFGFHLVNVACHLGSSALVFFLCQRLLRDTGHAAEAGVIAFLVALIFALHPVQTEAVTYVSGRSVALMNLFYLGAIAAYAQATEGENRWWGGLSLVLFIGAVAVKETAVTLPFALLLWDQARSGEPLKASVRRLWIHFLLLALLAAAVLLHARYRHLLAVSLGTRAPLENLAVQVHGIWYLITGPLLALRSNSDPVVDVHWPWYVTLAKGGLLLGLIGAGFMQLRGRPWLGFGLLWFFLQLLPTNSFVARLDVANDRQLYLAILGPALILAVALVRWVPSPIAAVTGLLLVLTLAGATVARNADYRDEITFWEATTSVSPDKARAWNNLGYAYQLAGRNAEARAAYERALALDPAHWRARVNLLVLDDEDASALQQARQ